MSWSVKSILSENVASEFGKYIANNKIGSITKFLKKKKKVERTSSPYAYQIHYRKKLNNITDDFSAFFLAGPNWEEKPDAPIVLAFGFNRWKFGIIADYLPEYRVAFARPSIKGFYGRWAMSSLSFTPAAVYNWGYSTPKFVERFVASKKISLIRVEDAFLRSAEIGASHSTPCSLVFDKKGMYYNSLSRNDLTDILDKIDLSSDRELELNARNCLDLLIESKLSKYNLPEYLIEKVTNRPKIKKRILVIGQVDRDAAVRLGNPQNFTFSDIIDAALCENPDAEILYRPHPEVYKGYAKTRFKSKELDSRVTLTKPTESLIDLLETVDHVYTLSSLSGLEAIVRGIKVSVFGTPFYSGWGLTDDRCDIKRGRTLSVLELFAGVYLKYPKYLVSPDNPVIGFQSAAYKIMSDRVLLMKGVFARAKESRCLQKTKIWFADLFGYEGELPEEIVRNLTLVQSLRYIISRNGVPRYQEAILIWLAGIAARNGILDSYLNAAKVVAEEKSFQRALDFLTSKNGKSVVSRFKFTDDFFKSYEEEDVFTASIIKEIKSQHDAFEAGSKDFELDEVVLEDMLQVARVLLTKKKLDIANRILMELIFFGYKPDAIFLELAQLFRLQFDFLDAATISNLVIITGGSKRLEKFMAIYLDCKQVNNREESLKDAALAINVSPDRAYYAIKSVENVELNHSSDREIIANIPYLDGTLSFMKVRGFLALEDPGRAERILRMMHDNNQSSTAMWAWSMCQALSFGGKVKEAIAICDQALGVFETPLLYRERLRLCILEGDYENAEIVMHNAELNNVDIGDMLSRKINFGLRRPEEAFKFFRDIKLKNNVRSYFPEKYCDAPLASGEARKLFMPAIYGPGDEIRFASVYKKIRSLLPQKNVTIGTDPRLVEIFQRSFDGFNFAPVGRVRYLNRNDLSNFSELPGSDIHDALDNKGIDEVKKADEICLVTDLLSDAIKGYQDFEGVPWLKVDEEKARKYSDILPKEKKIVGLCWRSSVVSHSRNEHYFTIRELEPLFSIENVQFVNLQYDDCDEELAWVEERFPGKLIHLSELDQYNDLDGVAALMTNLDLFIGVATTPIELAGAVGCRSWLLSNSSELHWRRDDETLIDIWSKSISHIENRPGDEKEVLVSKLVEELKKFIGSD
ncbi:hypothetical protein [uncultured Roseibium sp.]|uniref:capsular polysaccharide export protein, LipB/KpsS family n=1 Tax=uncultured Roseibium sp. TaxID=1936171 RepID=UPI0026367E42|nr:hypothetical protein [uncultured Roseibium sp.]